jgi:hypothetical protein
LTGSILNDQIGLARQGGARTMGHIHLGVLPRSQRWRDVVELLSSDAPDGAVIAASARAAESDLLSATNSAGFVEAVRLLLMVPYAARSEDFADALRKAGLDIRSDPSPLELTTAVSSRLDAETRRGSDRSDLGELAGRALIGTLSLSIGDAVTGLFGATPEDVHAAARKLSWSRGISVLSRDFFARLVSGTLSYWLDRTLAQHVGADARFTDASARSAFDSALARHAHEATRIIEEFSGGWFGKTIHQKGEITTADARVFGAVALRKVVEELRLRRDPDG